MARSIREFRQHYGEIELSPIGISLENRIKLKENVGEAVG